jgi:hypothetical protein
MCVDVHAIFILFKRVKYISNFDVVCWVMRPCSLEGSYEHLVGTHSALEMETACSSKRW